MPNGSGGSRPGKAPLARIAGMAVGGVKPQLMGIGPVVSSKKAQDVVVLDISMPLMNGLEALKEISRVAPAARTLVLTKKLVTMMGGEISVKSQEGLGSTFSVILPTGQGEQT